MTTTRQIQPEGVIGTPRARIEGWAKVTGAARYGADHWPEQVAFGALRVSSVARGEITALEEGAARAVPGVLEVLTHRNVGKAIKPGRWFLKNGYMQTAFAPLRDARIRFGGQIVAMVVADTLEAAEQGAEALAVTYRAEAPVATVDDPRSQEVKAKSFNVTELKAGDVERGLAQAAVRVEADYATPAQHNNPIELFQATCAWEGDELTIWESSQNVRGIQYGVAKQLGIRAKHVRVRSPLVGGSFGARGEMGQMTAIVALAAKRVGRPVKLVASRRQGYTVRTYRADTRHHLRLGAAADGRLVALSHETVEATAKDEPFTAAGAEAMARLYACPNVWAKVRAKSVDRQTPGFMRGPAEVPYQFALESAMDELAWALDLDPLELRRRNETAVDPTSGLPYTSRSLLPCIEAAAAAFGWRGRVARPKAMRDGDELVGYGYATAFKPAMMGPADARVTLRPDGRATVEVGTHEIGNGIVTALALTAADRLGLAVEDVEVRVGDSALPAAAVTAGSNTTASVCNAVALACDKLRARLIKAAVRANGGPLAGQPPEFVRLRGREASAGGLGEPITAVIRRAGRGKPIVGRSAHNPHGLPRLIAPLLVRRGTPVIMGGSMLKDRMQFSFGAQFAEVRVHRHTGMIRVPRLVGAFAAGRIVNPKLAHDQLVGGMLFGLSAALMEETIMDERSGRWVNNDLAEYHVPVCADVNQAEAIIVDERDDEINPLGIKGLGEIGVTGVPPAVANAVYHATGVRVRRLPIRLDKLLSAR